MARPASEGQLRGSIKRTEFETKNGPKNYQKFPFGLAGVFFGAEVPPEDGVVDVAAAVESKSRLQGDDRFRVVWKFVKKIDSYLAFLISVQPH